MPDIPRALARFCGATGHGIREAAPPITRRAFLGRGACAALALLPLSPDGALARRLLGPRGADHPEPRPGVDGSRVLTADQLPPIGDVVALFDAVREIPHIVDGIRCYCGCAELEGYRSLLSCYEAPGMAQYCEICQGQGRLAHARWKEGQTLEQIRRATDARYGPGAAAPAADGHHHLHIAPTEDA